MSELRRPDAILDLSPTEEFLCKLFRTESRVSSARSIADTRVSLFRGSILDRAVSALFITIIFGCLVPLSTLIAITNFPAGPSSTVQLLEQIYLFASRWIFDDISSYISLSLALMTAGLTATVTVAAMDRSRYNADLENKTYIGKFSQFFNLTISTFFSAHLLLCLGWFFWREEDGGNISIFAPEVSAIGWIVTVLLASISIVDVSVLKTRRDSLYRELGNLNRGIDRRLEYRPLPLFNIINLAAFLSVLIVLVSDSALILTVAPPIRESGLIFTARHMVAALIASYATAYVYFTLTRMKSPQVGGRRIATYSANALYIILALACGALSASFWGSSYAYLIALPVQILTLALVPVLVKRSKVGRQRLHLSNNNFLLERRADLKRAIDRVNDQITEIDPK